MNQVVFMRTLVLAFDVQLHMEYLLGTFDDDTVVQFLLSLFAVGVGDDVEYLLKWTFIYFHRI